MSRPHTADECREKLIRHLVGIRDYWLNESMVSDEKKKLDGAIFSILVMIDGESTEMPAFLLMPAPHSDDAEFHQGRGENYWPKDVDLAADRELHHAWSDAIRPRDYDH